VTLSILIWLPLAIAVIGSQLPARLVGRFSAAASLIPLGIAISFVARFKPAGGLQFVTDKVWIGALGIHYKLGIDGLNVSLILLTAFLFTVSLVWSAFRDIERPRLYYFQFGLAESAVLGAFCAQDLALFVAFFDLMLIPFYFLIGAWGSGPDRVRATIKLVIYTMVGSFLMLAAAIATGVIASGQHGSSITFVLSSLQHLPLSRSSQEWIFLCFAAAFLVKMPLVPFHGWLADGYKAMPIPAVAVFSGVLSKVAAYGFLKIVIPLFPQAAQHYQLIMLLISLVSILWATSLAFTTNDARLVIAYSSVAQLGFITLGIFSLRPEGGQGALLQMVNHGLVTAAAFFVVAAVAERCGGSEDLREMGGVAFRAPVLATLFLVISLANLAMPGSSNFVGEFMILLGVFKTKLAISAIAFLGVVGAAVYALRLFITAMHNRVGGEVHSREIVLAEAAAIVPLVVVIIALAFYPQFGLKRSKDAVNTSLAAAAPAAVAQVAAATGMVTGTFTDGGYKVHSTPQVNVYVKPRGQ
jgi:NADH-quinone oxidoreductase subunit M